MKQGNGAPRAREEEPAEVEQLSGAVRNKVIEVADLLRHQAPEAPLSEEYLDSLVLDVTKGEGAIFTAAVLGAFPEVEDGERSGAFGERVLAEVRR